MNSYGDAIVPRRYKANRATSSGDLCRPNANSNCYHTVQLWADGTVSAVCGRIETEGTGGCIYVHEIDVAPDVARQAFERAIKAQKDKGYRVQPRPTVAA